MCVGCIFSRGYYYQSHPIKLVVETHTQNEQILMQGSKKHEKTRGYDASKGMSNSLAKDTKDKEIAKWPEK